MVRVEQTGNNFFPTNNSVSKAKSDSNDIKLFEKNPLGVGDGFVKTDKPEDFEKKRLEQTEAQVKNMLKTKKLDLAQFTGVFGATVEELMQAFEIDADKFAQLQANPERLEELLNTDEFKEICTMYSQILNEIEDKEYDAKIMYPAINPDTGEENNGALTAEQKKDLAKRQAELKVLYKDQGYIYKDMINYLTQNM